MEEPNKESEELCSSLKELAWNEKLKLNWVKYGKERTKFSISRSYTGLAASGFCIMSICLFYWQFSNLASDMQLKHVNPASEYKWSVDA
ncbi:hypothetical protein LIER_43686 [Lithospermum erythrorhizon]|uniref:Uncharacterized protein n=1 Tax=Lithospermum erythrorhizon TaxID=34254 RepID=A0AAV3QNH5_LITER